MNVLTLDLSKSRTGWCRWQDGWEAPRFGHWVLGSEYTDRGQMNGKLHRCMAELYSVMPFEEIVAEEPINPGQLNGQTSINTIRIAIGLAEHAHSFARAYGLRYREVNVSTWRLDFVGRGEMAQIRQEVKARAKAAGRKISQTDDTKAATIARCRQLGFSPRCNDEADAIGLCDYVLWSQRVTPPWRANEVLRPPLGAAQ